MALNGLGPRALRRVARLTGLPIVRATVMSHADHWLVWLTLNPHRHAVFDKRTGLTTVFHPSNRAQCTTLCEELFPELVTKTDRL